MDGWVNFHGIGPHRGGKRGHQLEIELMTTSSPDLSNKPLQLKTQNPHQKTNNLDNRLRPPKGSILESAVVWEQPISMLVRITCMVHPPARS